MVPRRPLDFFTLLSFTPLVVPLDRYVAPTYLLCLPLLRKLPGCVRKIPILELMPHWPCPLSSFLLMHLREPHFATPFFSYLCMEWGVYPHVPISEPREFPTFRTCGRSEVPLQATAFGATIRHGTKRAIGGGKQIPPRWCLRRVSGHRGLLDPVPGCKSCLGLAFYMWVSGFVLSIPELNGFQGLYLQTLS